MKGKIYKYEGLGAAIEFAESGDWDSEAADACEEEVLEFIKPKGYRLEYSA